MDVHNKKQRSFNMSRIKRENTKPELQLRKALWHSGIRYRLKSKLPGKPDLVFPKLKVAIFVDGCFWHKCPEHFVKPKTRASFWMGKINANTDRDEFVNKELNRMGWKILRLWEHEIKANKDGCVKKIEHELKQS